MPEIVNAPGFWELMKHLAQVAYDANGDEWHTFSVELRSDGVTIWVAYADLHRRLLPVTGPTIRHSGA